MIRRGAESIRRIPTGNAHVVLATGLFIIEVDDELAGLPLYEELVEDLPASLSWRSRRGPKTVFRLPSGARCLRHGAELLSGLEILTDKAMAPGSTVDGFYVHTVALRPIATVDSQIADSLAELVPATTAPRAPMSFVVREHAWSPGARRSRPAGHAPAERAAGEPDRAALELRASWLAESRPRHRHQAQYRVALQMQRFNEDFESFLELVISNPVGGNLQGKGDPRIRLSKTWQSAGQEVRTSPPRDVDAPAEARAMHGKPQEAEVWLAHTRERVQHLWSDNTARVQRITELATLHASWMARFGLVYHLSHDLMQTYLGISSNKQLSKYLALLQVHGFLRTRPELRDRQEKSTYWEALINSEPLTTSPRPWVSSTPPTSDLRFLDDEEIEWLLGHAARRDAEALERRRQNARSERIAQVRRRASDPRSQPPA